MLLGPLFLMYSCQGGALLRRLAIGFQAAGGRAGSCVTRQLLATQQPAGGSLSPIVTCVWSSLGLWLVAALIAGAISNIGWPLEIERVSLLRHPCIPGSEL